MDRQDVAKGVRSPLPVKEDATRRGRGLTGQGVLKQRTGLLVMSVVLSVIK